MKIKFAAMALAAAMMASASAFEDVALWPDAKMPDEQTDQETPYLRWCEPEKRTSDICVIVAPGGGYLKTDLDGTAASMAKKFNEKGVTVALLRYRTPRPKGLPKHLSAWQDAQRAIRIVRSQAGNRGFSAEKIGMIGFSAGGHLTLMCATSSSTNTYERIDEIDDMPTNLSFAIPVYPAYVLTDGANSKNTHGGNDADMVGDFIFDVATPPMCLVHGDADVYSAMGSVKVYHRLRKMGIPAELHIYAGITHAFGGSNTKIPEPPLWWDEAWLWISKYCPHGNAD